MKQRKKDCKKCEHSTLNFWNYVECWVTEKRLDTTSTKYTAIRERYAHTLNKDGDCTLYKRKKIKFLFWKI